MDKIRGVTIAVILFLLIGCGTTEGRRETEMLPVKDKISDTLNEKVALLENGGAGAEKVVGYAASGMPLRLPGRVIRIYIAPMKSPMGRLIGEHYVWAVVQEESWWTPGETGLDTIAPSDLHKEHLSEEEKK